MIESPYDEPFTVIAIAFDVTNAKNVTINFWKTGTSETVCQFRSVPCFFKLWYLSEHLYNCKV